MSDLNDLAFKLRGMSAEMQRAEVFSAEPTLRRFAGLPTLAWDCPCGDDECLYLECGYWFCPGCMEHHRPQVANPCPIVD